MTDSQDELLMAVNEFKEKQDAEIHEALKVAMKAFWDHVGDTDLIYNPLQPLTALLQEVDKQYQELSDKYADYNGAPGKDGINWAPEASTEPVEPKEGDIVW